MRQEILQNIGISQRHLDYMLSGERNASPSLARRLELKTGIKKELWVFGSAMERKLAWKRYKQRIKRELEGRQ